MVDVSGAEWATSTYSSGSGGNCVELALVEITKD